MAISVAVADSTPGALIDELMPRIESLVIAPGTQTDAALGPSVTKLHLERVLAYLASGRMDAIVPCLRVEGYLSDPRYSTTHVRKCVSRRDFGPVLCVVRVPTFDTLLKLFDLHEDGDTGARLPLRSAVVGVNLWTAVPMAFHSFGGWTLLSFGNHGVH